MKNVTRVRSQCKINGSKHVYIARVIQDICEHQTTDTSGIVLQDAFGNLCIMNSPHVDVVVERGRRRSRIESTRLRHRRR